MPTLRLPTGRELQEALREDDGFVGDETTGAPGVPTRRTSRGLGEAHGGTDPEHVTWAFDHDHIDYDLLPAGSTAEFELSGRTLRELMALNAFPTPDRNDQPRVLFGLRGCTTASGTDSDQWRTSVRLTEATPDHDELRCVLGIWDQHTDKVTAFVASTVPNWAYMWKTTLFEWAGNDKADPKQWAKAWRKPAGKLESHTMRSCLLPTGLYTYKAGRHKEMPGAFRLDQDVMVLRSMTNLEYTSQDFWDGPINPFTNIHPAYNDLRRSPTHPNHHKPKFAAAGCQTVPGAYSGGEHKRAWAKFRTLAGQQDLSGDGDHGRPYSYVLLTGREARMVAEGGHTGTLQRLRHGSVSPLVGMLKDKLKASGHLSRRANSAPDLDPWTVDALIRWQRRGGPKANDALGFAPPANGKVDAKLAESLGLPWHRGLV